MKLKSLLEDDFDETLKKISTPWIREMMIRVRKENEGKWAPESKTPEEIRQEELKKYEGKFIWTKAKMIEHIRNLISESDFYLKKACRILLDEKEPGYGFNRYNKPVVEDYIYNEEDKEHARAIVLHYVNQLWNLDKKNYVEGGTKRAPVYAIKKDNWDYEA
jgi:hypothetical protein